LDFVFSVIRHSISKEGVSMLDRTLALLFRPLFVVAGLLVSVTLVPSGASAQGPDPAPDENYFCGVVYESFTSGDPSLLSDLGIADGALYAGRIATLDREPDSPPGGVVNSWDCAQVGDECGTLDLRFEGDPSLTMLPGAIERINRNEQTYRADVNFDDTLPGGVGELRFQLLCIGGCWSVDEIQSPGPQTVLLNPPIGEVSLQLGFPDGLTDVHMTMDILGGEACRDAYLAYGGEEPPIEVEIDIRPFSPSNRVNPLSHFSLPVVIWGSDSVAAGDVDVATLALGPGGAQAHHAQELDINGDGLDDLLAFYPPLDSGIEMGDTEACLTGTVAGEDFDACDVIETVHVGCGLGAELGLILAPMMLWRARRRQHPGRR
jgi:hypothetical protein